MRRFLLVGLLGLTAAGAGCCHHRAATGHHCCGPLFPNRAARLAATSAPMGYDAAPVGMGAPGCSSCATGSTTPGGYPSGYQASLPGQQNFSAGIPHDSVLLGNPTVLPPGTGTPRIDIDPPKPMPMTGK